jgi:hypothetical protein
MPRQPTATAPWLYLSMDKITWYSSLRLLIAYTKITFVSTYTDEVTGDQIDVYEDDRRG